MLKNLKTNSLLYKYLNGSQKNVMGTILGFSKVNTLFNEDQLKIYTKQIKKDINNDKPLNVHLSFLLYYDHTRCRVTRYLFNIGLPYQIKIIDKSKEIKYKPNDLIVEHELNTINNTLIKYIYKEDTNYNFNDSKHSFINLINGKLDKKFFFYFLMDIIYNKCNNSDTAFKNLYDMRVINELNNRFDILNDPENILENKYFELNPDKPIILNIPKKFYGSYINNEGLEKNFNTLNIKLEPYLLKDLPKSLLDLRSFINLKEVHNPTYLEDYINIYNDNIVNKIKLNLNDNLLNSKL